LKDSPDQPKSILSSRPTHEKILSFMLSSLFTKIQCIWLDSGSPKQAVRYRNRNRIKSIKINLNAPIIAKPQFYAI